MKRFLTLTAIAVALGTAEWRQSPEVRAGESNPAVFDRMELAVNATPRAVALGAEDDSSTTAPAEEPLASAEEPAAADTGAEESADDPSQANSAEELPLTSDPSVRTTDDGREIEVIRERFPNRTVKIEREVTQDSEGNYVNHGPWKMWDAQGILVAEGQYQNGERVGVWSRWYRNADIELLKTAPYNAFHGPFISQASFDHGKLNGKWTIYDSHQHRISEWEFADGQRHGNFTWWFPNGTKMRECHFDGNEMNGRLMEWAPNARLVTQATYEHGRRLGSHAEKHPSGAKKSEGSYLFAREILQTPDDWWNATPAVYAKQGKDERHGHWAAWYPNGQKQTEGEYDHDVPVGEFTWWHANGERKLQGEYSDGEQQGKWVWWHENGQKSIQGDYRQGHPIGQWTWWNNDGKVARGSKLEGGAGQIVQAPAPSPKSAPSPPQSASRTNGALGQPRATTVR